MTIAPKSAAIHFVDPARYANNQCRGVDTESFVSQFKDGRAVIENGNGMSVLSTFDDIPKIGGC
ncbi:hypothetical protein [Burkholderia ubonensis]|uniref:hypothetical protein n=1 Tax=Burkholderia ubonensis TaxID=101571 RepID=UPI000A6885C6|nr:hypothetical protein [Burkholderia ubonensis]